MNKQEVIKRMCESGLLPVFRTADLKNLYPASKAFYEAGIGCVEYTMTMPGALDLVKEGIAKLPKELFLGAGTVMDGKTVELAVQAGAKFIASPGIDASMIEACNRLGVVSVVGAMTPSEIMTAVRLGADVIKVFPAITVGPAFFIDVLGPFPGLHLMAAGGMSLLTLKDYVTAGAEILTFLANGLEPAAYATGDCATITCTAKKWVEAVAAARKAKK
jgi:2-dehydro-3-deoxyphosphogluconate aldolase/(4S)-4-hydroxy-2-oxoglutarate aldolase